MFIGNLRFSLIDCFVTSLRILSQLQYVSADDQFKIVQYIKIRISMALKEQVDNRGTFCFQSDGDLSRLTERFSFSPLNKILPVPSESNMKGYTTRLTFMLEDIVRFRQRTTVLVETSDSATRTDTPQLLFAMYRSLRPLLVLKRNMSHPIYINRIVPVPLRVWSSNY